MNVTLILHYCHLCQVIPNLDTNMPQTCRRHEQRICYKSQTLILSSTTAERLFKIISHCDVHQRFGPSIVMGRLSCPVLIWWMFSLYMLPGIPTLYLPNKNSQQVLIDTTIRRTPVCENSDGNPQICVNCLISTTFWTDEKSQNPF